MGLDPAEPQPSVSLWMELVDLAHGEEPHHRRLRHRLFVIFCALVFVDLVSTVFLWLIHGLMGDKRANLAALWHSFVWTTSQLLTGGSSLSAQREGAHVLEMALELLAVTAVAALAGSTAAFFLQKDAASGDN
jgi:hypothetical protein